MSDILINFVHHYGKESLGNLFEDVALVDALEAVEAAFGVDSPEAAYVREGYRDPQK
jgi:hypothetical protein